MTTNTMTDAALASVQAVCVVADRANLEALIEITTQFGGAWLETARQFERVKKCAYVVMLAHEPRRIAKRAPLVFFSMNEEGFRQTIKAACSELSNHERCKPLTCMWVPSLGPKGLAIINPILAAEAACEGSA